MAKRKRLSAGRASKSAAKPRAKRSPKAEPTAEEEQIAYSNLSLHELFQQQTRTLLDRADLDEEQKQSLLIAMSCPCCGAGGMSFTAKLKRRS
jgi:hypothetical protein